MATTGKTPPTLTPRRSDEPRATTSVHDPIARFDEAKARVARSDTEYSDVSDTPARPSKGPASEQYAARINNLDGFLNKLRNA